MALLQLHTLAPHCRPTTHQIQMFFICKTETKLCWNVCGCTKTVWGLAVLHLWEYISRGSFSQQCLFAVVVDQFNFIHSLWWLFFLLFIPCIHSNGNVPTQFRLILQIWQCQSLCQSQLQPDSLFSLCYLREMSRSVPWACMYNTIAFHCSHIYINMCSGFQGVGSITNA